MKLFPFFKRDGIIIIPANIIGWLLVAITLAYSIYEFFEIDSHSHSVSDTLINFVLNLFINTIVLYIIALFTSKKA